jgi:hypothetical protein
MGLIRRREAQQFGNGISASLMDRGANRHLCGLKVQPAAPVPIGEDPLHLLF